ncbi:MAG: hypothetical protein KDD15_08065, partial [Lewinella sp.]|nr:hypothetical protein [Lewinella sp.]
KRLTGGAFVNDTSSTVSRSSVTARKMTNQDKTGNGYNKISEEVVLTIIYPKKAIPEIIATFH